MIPFLDLKKINKPYENAFQEKLNGFLGSGWYILGNEVREFETSFAAYCGTKYCIGTGNGFDALVLIFKAYIELGKLQKGDEVIVPANTYIASILAILQADLLPVLVEPKLDTYNIDPNLIEAKLTSKTRAILVVHLYGQQAEMNRINEVAVANELLVIEDAAQAHGASFENESTNVRNLEPKTQAYSFYPGKNLGALGDAGAVTTNDSELAKVIQSLRNYGSETKYYNDYVGINSRLDELQAAFLNVKLPFLNGENDRRRTVAKRYLAEIKNEKIILPTVVWEEAKQPNSVFHLFVIRTQNREKLQAYLLQNGIQTLIHYPVPPHRQKAFYSKIPGWNTLSLPITEKIHEEVLSLPISPVLTMEEVGYIITVLNTY